MDSITQIALGAAVGEATLGARVGRKAALWGALCGTLPDLDVLVPMADPVASFTYHRSFSHSLFVLALLTPMMVWLIRKIHPQHAVHRLGWHALVYLAFATHVLLDSFTIYGTQIFWPLNNTPMTWGSVFIIDPLYTLPLIGGLVILAASRSRPRLGHIANAVGLAISTVYLAWSLGAKLHVQNTAAASLSAQSIEHDRLVALAGPLNTILWRVIAMDRDGYYVGWYSLLDADRRIDFVRYPSDTGLLDTLADHWPVSRLKWFTKGFYRVREEDGAVVITDLRMGVESGYIFGFKVAQIANPHPQPTPAEARYGQPNVSGAGALWQRLKGER